MYKIHFHRLHLSYGGETKLNCINQDNISSILIEMFALFYFIQQLLYSQSLQNITTQYS